MKSYKLNILRELMFMILLFSFTFFSCNVVSPDPFAGIPKPELTKNEKNYVQYLKKKGYKNIEIDKPFIGINPYGQSIYTISFDTNLILDSSNVNDYIKLRYEIATDMYSNVIEDSILYDCSKIDVEIGIAKEKSINHNLYRKTFLWIEKDSLEKWCGFKVVKIGKDKYKRVKV